MFKDRYDERQFTHGPDWNMARYGKITKCFEDNFRSQIEGWAAAAVAATVIGTGVAAYSSSQATSAQQAQANALSKQPNVVPATFEDPSTAYSEYNNLITNQYPSLAASTSSQNTTNNAAYQAQLNKTSPNLLAGISQQGTVANSLLNGQIPSDVQTQVQNSAAYQALSGGYGGSQAGNALTARDLGLTSLNLEQQGSTMLGQNLQNTASVNPSNLTASSMILTPQQLLSRDDSNNAYANAVLNKNKSIQYQNGIYAAAANSYNPTLSGVASGVGAVSSGSTMSNLGNAFNSISGSVNNTYSNPYANNYDAGTAAATSGGTYNPYLDTNNYDVNGSFIGNANSYG